MTRRHDGPSFIVRRATEQDSDAIASVLRRAFTEFEPRYTPAAFAATVPTADEIRARFDEGPVWVGACGDQIVGTVAAVLKVEGTYIRSMAIAPEARGHGLATRLLDHVERLAREHHAPCLFLSTTPFLTNAIRLYEGHGFYRTGDGPNVLFGTPLFTMKKILPGSAKITGSRGTSGTRPAVLECPASRSRLPARNATCSR